MSISRQPRLAANAPGNPGGALFAVLEKTMPPVKPEEFIEPAALEGRLHALQAVFDADCARVADCADLLTGDDITAYGMRCSALFDRWEKEKGGPALPALISHAIRHFGFDAEGPEARAMFAAAVLGEMPNSLQYHGNEHYRKVLFHSIRLAARNWQLFPGEKGQLTRDSVAVLLAAACVHDLGHKGGDNLRDDVYTPGYMEQRAFDIARPYLEAVGYDRDRMGEIETIVFCTDITFFAGDNSPCIRMKKIFKHYFWGDEGEDVSTMTMGKLRRFEDNKPLILVAMMLHEADVGTSAGLSYERTVKETIDLMAERAVKAAGPKTVLAFLREQLGETMFTEAGKQIFGPVLKDVIAHAEEDLAAGRTNFMA
jgi:hypothetical protein